MVNMLEWAAYSVIILSAIHTILVLRYNFRRRNVERLLGIFLFIAVLVEFILYTMIFIERDYGYRVVFEYIYNEASISHIITSIFYTNPFVPATLILLLLSLITRYMFMGYMGREHFRRFVWGSSLYTLVIHIGILVSGIYDSTGYVVGQGMGGFLFQSDPLFITLYIFIFTASILAIFSGLVLYATWVRKIDRLFGWAGLSTTAALALLMAGFVLRIYMYVLLEARRDPIVFKTIDLVILGGLAAILFAKDSLVLGRRRVLGCLAFSSTLLISYFTMVLAYMEPSIMLGSVNAIDIYKLSSFLILPFILGFILMGMEVYRRPFYPWMSTDDDYFIRVSTSSVYFLVVVSILYMVLTLSVYYTFGGSPAPSGEYAYSVYVIFLISIVMAPLSYAVILRWRNFYLLYGLIVLLLLLFVGARTYKLFDLSGYVQYMGVIGLVSSLILIVRGRFRKGVVIYGLLFSMVFALIYVAGAPGNYDTGNIVGLGSMSFDGLKVDYISHRLIDSPILVSLRDGNATSPLYKGIEVELGLANGEYVIRRVQQPSVDVFYSPGILIDNGLSTYKVLVSSFTADGSSITIGIAKYGFISSLLLAIYTVVGAIALILYDKEF